MLTVRDAFLPSCLQKLSAYLLRHDVKTVAMPYESAKDYKNFFALFPTITFFLID
jgi:hypothetical protein